MRMNGVMMVIIRTRLVVACTVRRFKPKLLSKLLSELFFSYKTAMESMELCVEAVLAVLRKLFVPDIDVLVLLRNQEAFWVSESLELIDKRRLSNDCHLIK
jgi:hypothetical protein